MKVRSMRGQQVDMARLIAQNSHKVAVDGHPGGLASMNARGDILGANGQVTVRREEIAREYHDKNPKAVKQVALRNISQEVLSAETPQQAVAKSREAMKELQKKQRKIVDGE